MNNSEQEKILKLIESAKKHVNPNCSYCGGTGYDPYHNHNRSVTCLDCEKWSNDFLLCHFELFRKTL